jgi:hypothetical protein
MTNKTMAHHTLSYVHVDLEIIYIICGLFSSGCVISIVWTKKHLNNKSSILFNWHEIADYVISGSVGFGLRFTQERKNNPRPYLPFQIMASIALGFVGYFLYSFYHVRFSPPEILIAALAWMGGYIVVTGDYIIKNGIIIYLRKIAEDFLAFTRKGK